MTQESRALNPEARLALAEYRARNRYMDEALDQLGKGCPNPPPIEEIQEEAARYIKGTTLSELVIRARREEP